MTSKAMRRNRNPGRTRSTSTTPAKSPRSGAGRVWNAICITALVIGIIALVSYAGYQAFGLAASLFESIGHQLGAAPAASGERMGWWGEPLVLLTCVLGVEVLWALYTLVFWRPQTKPEWQVPDSELSREDLALRRQDEAEWRLENPSEMRHPLLRRGTWTSMVFFTLMVAAPAFLEANLMANSPKPTYADGREGLLSIGRTCPALGPEIDAMIAKGVPTPEQVVSMRVRAKVIAEAPLKGQECRA